MFRGQKRPYRIPLNEGGRPAVVLLALLVIAGSLFWISYSLRPRHRQANLQLHRAVGQVLAEETSKRVGPKGRILVVTSASHPSPAQTAELEAFDQTIRKLGGVTPTRSRIPLDREGRDGSEPRMTGGIFLDLMQQHSDVDAIVSLVGVPYLQDRHLAQFNRKRPLFIAVTRYNGQLKTLLKNHVLQVAIVDRFDSFSLSTRKPQTAREWFDFYFQVVTEEEASTLPY